MKPFFLQTILALLAFFSSQSPQAQTNTTAKPAWVSDKGYWVVESHKQTPKDAIVYFYTNEHALVYKEEIKNQKLNLKKKQTLLRLKAALEEAIYLRASGVWVEQKKLVTGYLQN